MKYSEIYIGLVKELKHTISLKDLVVFIASEKANFFSGETFRLNGGQFML